MSEHKTTPRTHYERGWDAALREREYAGAKTVPDNPYPEGTPEWRAWDEGFGDGTDFMIRHAGGEFDPPEDDNG
jgi:hypothetical protein